MPQPLIHNKEEIQFKLSQLGFDNADDVLKSAEYLYSNRVSSPSGIRLIDPTAVNSENRSGYVIELNRMGNSEDYQMNHIGFYADIKNDRSKDGLKRVSRYWFISDGPMPHKERMQWQMAWAIKIESAKESFLSRPAAIQTASDNINGLTVPLDKDLETELNRQGFPHSSQMLQIASYADNLAFLTIAEKPDSVRFPGFDTFAFFFALVYPDHETPLQIEYLNASLTRNGQQNGSPKLVLEKDYWLARADLPTKNEVLREFYMTHDVIQARRPNPPLIKIPIKDRSPGRGFRR